MTTSTTHMLRVLGPSTSKENTSDVGGLENQQVTPTEEQAAPHLAFAPVPTPSMSDMLNYCLAQNKQQDNTPTS
jgi:hypothetical protein